MIRTLLLVVLLALPSLACSQRVVDTPARQALILANVEVEIEQLRGAPLSISRLVESAIAGLDEGELVLPNGQTVPFYISHDNKHLLLLAVPAIDASRDSTQLAALAAQQMQAEREARVQVAAQLEAQFADMPSRGPDSAPVKMIVFSDFQCPFCARVVEPMNRLSQEFGDQLQIRFAHFPLDFHAWAVPSALALTCVGFQSDAAFWTAHDALFALQRQINEGNVMAKMRELATAARVDLAQYDQCVNQNSETYTRAMGIVEAQFNLGRTLGVSGTPGFFVNGRFLNGALPYDQLAGAVREALTP